MKGEKQKEHGYRSYKLTIINVRKNSLKANFSNMLHLCIWDL